MALLSFNYMHQFYSHMRMLTTTQSQLTTCRISLTTEMILSYLWLY
jgi:hypothetical protein